MKKRILSAFLIFACLFSLVSLAGCGGKKESTVYFLNFKPEAASVYEELAEKLIAMRKQMEEDVLKKDCELQEKLK